MPGDDRPDPPRFTPEDLPGPRDPLISSDAAWLHDVFARVAAARNAGDSAEVTRLLDYVTAEGGPHSRELVEQVIKATDAVKAGQAEVNIGLGGGELLCDFCTAATVVAYYPMQEFSLVAAGGEWRSGDRMYACARCRELVDAGDWAALRRWVGPGARTWGVKLLWMGFRTNRTGGPIQINKREDQP